MGTAKSSSETLNESDYLALHLAMERLARITIGDGLDAILEALTPCVPVAAGLFGVVKLASIPNVTNVPLRLPTAVLQSWMGTNPEHLEQAYVPVIKHSPGAFWCNGEGLPDEVRKSLHVLQGLDQFNLGEGAGYKVHQRALPDGGVEHLMMALITERGTRFPAHTAARLKALVPAVEAAYWRLGVPLVASNPILEQIMEEDSIGYMCLDAKGTVTELNQRAHDLALRYRDAACISQSRQFLQDFVHRAQNATANVRVWQLAHEHGTTVLEMRVHQLRKEKLRLSNDIYLLTMQEWTLPTPPEDPGIPAVFECLTDRERQIAMILLRSGLANMEIACELKISPNTVRTHVEHIHRKLKVRTRAELVELVNRKKG